MARRREAAKWFEPGEKPTGWEKGNTQKQRRSAVLKSKKGNLLASARAMQALANVTKDKKTAQLAGQDASYFYALYRKEKGSKH